MDDQVKTAIESLGKTFEAFKETHQEELKQSKKMVLLILLLLTNFLKLKNL